MKALYTTEKLEPSGVRGLLDQLRDRLSRMARDTDEDGGSSVLHRPEELRSELADSKDAEDEAEAEENESDDVPTFEEFMRMMSDDEV